MHINLTKVALLAAVYFLCKNNVEMNDMRAKLKAAEDKLNNITVA